MELKVLSKEEFEEDSVWQLSFERSGLPVDDYREIFMKPWLSAYNKGKDAYEFYLEEIIPYYTKLGRLLRGQDG